MKRHVISFMVTLLILFCLTALSVADDKEAIKFGAIVSLTGDGAEQDIDVMRAISLAEEIVNANGGINGYPVKVAFVDGQTSPAVFATKAHRLLDSEQVIAGCGGNDISVATAAGKVFQDNKTPFLDIIGTTPTIPLLGEYMFMTPTPDNDMGRAVAKYIYEKEGYDTVTIFKDVASAYGTKLTEYIIHFLKEFTGKENPVPFVPSYNTGDNDYSAQLIRLKSLEKKMGIEAVILPCWPRDIPKIAKQARELGITLPLIGGDAADTNALIEVGGEAVEGLKFCTHFDLNQEGLSDKVKDFAKKFKEKYGHNVNASGAMGYDSFMIMTKAVTDLINEKGEKWWDHASLAEKRIATRDAIAAVETGDWTTQPLSFSPEGWPKREAVVWKVVKNQERVYLDVQPYDEFTPAGINTLPFK